MDDLRPSCETTTLLKVVVRDVGGAVPQRERRSRIHTAHRPGNRASGGAILAGAVADVFADVGARPCFTLYTNLHFTPIARRPLGMQVARRLEATHGRALNVRAKRDAEWAEWGLIRSACPGEPMARSTQKRSPIITGRGGTPLAHKLLKRATGPACVPAYPTGSF